MSGPCGPQTFGVALLRWVLSYDETLDGPALTIMGNILPKSRVSILTQATVEIDDFRASQKWHEVRQKEKRRAARIVRLKSLFTLQCVSPFWKNLKPNAFGKT